MVNKFFILFSLLPLFLFGGEFTATVSRNQVNLRDPFTLTLTLKDASTQNIPSIEPLLAAFSITSQQQLFNTVVLNGRVTTTTSWKYTLLPLKEGEFAIPALTIETQQGVLSTKPINIQVIKNEGVENSTPDDIVFIAEVSNPKPYKNEPVFYTLKMLSKRDLTEVKLQKIAIENAILEASGEAKIFRKNIDGVNMTVLEVNYLITPLKAGTLTIPSAAIQGLMAVKRKSSNGFSDDDFDPFSMLHGFDRLKPFTVTTNELSLEVQPPVAEVNPWIPAKSLQIEELWEEGQLLQVGEPLSRAFKITAEGIKASQLPSLNELLTGNASFKIYADKPETGDEMKEGSLMSFRKEHYTLIPQKEGTLTLPEISVAWWDVNKKEKVIARVPARVLDVLPRAKSSTGGENELAYLNETPTSSISQEDNPRASFLYALLAILAILLCGAISWICILQKKISRLTTRRGTHRVAGDEKYRQYAPPQPRKRESLPDLNPT